MIFCHKVSIAIEDFRAEIKMDFFTDGLDSCHFVLLPHAPCTLTIAIGSPMPSTGIRLQSTCSARDWERSGLLEENPQSGCTEICASLKGPL